MERILAKSSLGGLLPLVRSLGNGLHEGRSNIPNGIARVIFKIINGKMVLFHGFIKKTQKTPGQDLDLAKERTKNMKKKKEITKINIHSGSSFDDFLKEEGIFDHRQKSARNMPSSCN